jgi:isoleucyl-tRNA synthetase
VSDRIVATIDGDAAPLASLAAHREWLAQEILAVELEIGEGHDLGPDRAVEEVTLPGGSMRLALRRA